MFGYVLLNERTLSDAEKQRFRAAYCGLCHTLRRQYGQLGRLSLSNDMTFLSLLLGSLYDAEEKTEALRCALHPLRTRPVICHEATAYAAAMNVLLMYHKCADDAADEHPLRGKAGLQLLHLAFERAREQYPRQSYEIAEGVAQLRTLEKEQSTDLDALCRPAGRLLGACFVWREDVFAKPLRRMGEAMGRFIYLMDAYEDYAADMRHKQFNPLREIHDLPDYEERMRDILTMEMAECTQAFDYLPIVEDAPLMQNILYSGIWGRYSQLSKQRKETQQ